MCWASRGDATPEERSRVSQTVPSVGTSSVPRVRAGYIVFCYNCVLNCVLNYKGKKLAETRAASQENQTEIFIFFQKCSHLHQHYKTADFHTSPAYYTSAS